MHEGGHSQVPPPPPTPCMLSPSCPLHVGVWRRTYVTAADAVLGLVHLSYPNPQADLCSPSDLLQGTAQGLWTTLEAVRRAGARVPPPLRAPSGLGGFIFFYTALMLLLYVVYTRLLGP